ncbi:hypothetical protein AS159_06990 [Thermotoga sp. Ku-13t]|uniref:hypothetical protein n=1 Tax=Thermotoga sp. Ku-13t TaxID=1755813 RepID=UPI0013EC6E38|nr:hypothetical protein [Thermotoga sp. Ku-13t]KAF2957417.1 hypothetical protein AS159_06990 [Thermotoga sp. Ku-13t]
MNFSVALTWNHHWVKTGWFSWSYRLDKFETLISLSPSITPSLEVSSDGSIEKIVDQGRSVQKGEYRDFLGELCSRSVTAVAELDAEATAKIYGSIGFKIWPLTRSTPQSG